VEKIKDLVNSPLTKCVVAMAIGGLLLIKKDILFAGIAFGVGVREFLLAFKQDCSRNCKKECCLK
jgi:hypothetical protein|tara:strand:- start:2092 stop:2286 length:195 start_codon:yes stop_codon:yes gene_type:complete